VLSTDCEGILPLGEGSGLWGIFKCVTFSGNYLYLGMCQQAGGVPLQTLTVLGETEDRHGSTPPEPLVVSVVVDPTEEHVQVPMSNFPLLRGLKIKSPFMLVLPPWSYESDSTTTSELMVLGRSFFYVASLTICQDPIIIATNATLLIHEEISALASLEGNDIPNEGFAAGTDGNIFSQLEGDISQNSQVNNVMGGQSSTAMGWDVMGGLDTNSKRSSRLGHGNHTARQFRHVFVMPFKCRAEDSGLLIFIRIMGAATLAMMVSWFFNRAETWVSGFMGFKGKAQTVRGSPEFYPSSFLVGFASTPTRGTDTLRVPRSRDRAGYLFDPAPTPPDTPIDGEIQIAWLFLMSLMLWNVGSVMLVHGRALCLLCPITWDCPLNPLMPTSLQGISNLFLISMTPLLTVICVVISLGSKYIPSWTLTLVPVPQLGMAVVWLLTIPMNGDPVEILTWLTVTVIWNWLTIWDAITLVSGASILSKHEGTVSRVRGMNLRGGARAKFMAVLGVLEATLLILASACSVFKPVFVYYGPGIAPVVVVWLLFFVFILGISPPLILALGMKAISSEEEGSAVAPRALRRAVHFSEFHED
jgi:hypothetical protein